HSASCSYTLSLHDALPILEQFAKQEKVPVVHFEKGQRKDDVAAAYRKKFRGEEGVLFIGKAQQKTPVFRTERRRNEQTGATYPRSEEHTSELQSRGHLVCR